ncbi:unnamed protein product [Urochloa humidicola]
MDARDEDVAKGDPSPPAVEVATFEATGGELAGLQPVGQDGGGVDFAVQGSTVIGGAADDFLPQDLLLRRPAGGATGFDLPPDLGGVSSTGLRLRARARRIRVGGGHDRAVVDPGPAAAGGGGELDSPNQPAEGPLLLLDMERVGVADDADPRAPVQAPPAGRHGPEQDPVGAAMRSAALLAMFCAAMALIGDQDASRPGQFRTLMFWLAGCIGLFRWFLSRRR